MNWFLALVASLALAAAPKAPPAPSAAFPTTAALTTSDGVTVQAVWGAPAKAERAVVLVHGAGRTGDDWNLLADALFRQGLIVAVVDLRGHGASASAVAADLTPNDYAAMHKDVQATVAHVRATGASKVALVGADLGANLALNVAADDPDIASVALLSPGMDYKGVITTDAIRRYGARPALFVASADDAYGARSATSLDAAAQGPHRLELYEAAGKGARMLNREPSLEGTLVGFLQSSWVPQTGAAPSSAATVDVKITTEAMKTTGPTEIPNTTGAPVPKP
jgi:pimeloyl-ACP methyl ester carboxylesterase